MRRGLEAILPQRLIRFKSKRNAAARPVNRNGGDDLDAVHDTASDLDAARNAAGVLRPECSLLPVEHGLAPDRAGSHGGSIA
jgi:hypothetical protein